MVYEDEYINNSSSCFDNLQHYNIFCRQPVCH